MSDGITEASATVVPEMSPSERRDFESAQLYKLADPAQLHDQGAIQMKPHGDRLLLRAIRRADAFGGIFQATIDARDCDAHEVIAVGAGCAKWYDEKGVPEAERVKAGQHVFVVAAAADRASKTDRSVRLWFAKCEHIVSNWDKPAT